MLPGTIRPDHNSPKSKGDRMVNFVAFLVKGVAPVLIYISIVFMVSSWLFPTMPYMWGTLALLCGGLAVADHLRSLSP